MELKDAEIYANNPDKIIDPGTCNTAMAVINGRIMDQEEAEFELRLKVDKRHDELFVEHQVNAIADRKIKLDPIYIEWKMTERKVGQLKRLRRTLADRFTVLTQQKRY